MIDKLEAVELLDTLRREAYALRSEAVLGDSFLTWYDSVLSTLDRVFGPDSTERREFQRIRFELRQEALQSFEQGLRKEVEGRWGIKLPADLSLPQNQYYRRGLSEAAELLLAFRLGLQEESCDKT